MNVTVHARDLLRNGSSSDGGTASATKGRGSASEQAAPRTYRHDLETYVYPALGGVRFSELRRRDVQALVDRLVARGLSGSKVRNVIVTLQAIFRHARTRDTVTVDATEALELPEPGGRRERAASPEEAGALSDALPDDLQALGPRPRTADSTAASFARSASATSTSGRDEDRGQPRLRRRGGPDRAQEPQGDADRPGAGGASRYLLAEKLRTGRDGDDLLFGRTAREPFTPTHVRKLALRAWAAANETHGRGVAAARAARTPRGETHLRFPDRCGRDVARGGRRLPSATARRMTDRYRHLIEGQHERAADRLDAFPAGAQATRGGT